jgi:hypothetical protein
MDLDSEHVVKEKSTLAIQVNNFASLKTDWTK